MTVLYRGQDTPVFIDTTFVKRVQSFDAARQSERAGVTEANAQGVVGTIVKPSVYEATLRAYEIGQAVQWSAFGFTADWLTYIRAPQIVTVACVNGGISGAMLVRCELAASVREPAQSIYRLVGSGWATNSGAGTGYDPTDVPVWLKADCETSAGTKVQAARVVMGCSVQLVYELNATGVKGRIVTQPFAEIEIECAYPGTAPWIDADASAQDISLTTGTVVYTVKDCVSIGQPVQSSVRGWTTTKYRYRSLIGNVTF